MNTKNFDKLWEEFKNIEATNPITPEMLQRAKEIRNQLMAAGFGANDSRGWAIRISRIHEKLKKD